MEINTEKKNLNNFRVIDLNTKISLPQFREARYREWIEYGEDNLFPQFLTDVYQLKSITQKMIISRKSKMIYGEGIQTTASNQVLFNNIYDNDNLNELLIKIALDLELYAGFALNIIWDGTHTKIAQIHYIPFESVRIDKNNCNDSSKPSYYWISDDWRDIRRNKPKKVQGFSRRFMEETSQIFYYQDYQPGSQAYYPIPLYFSSINWILAEWEISNFHRASIQNGFNAAFLLNFATGIPSEEEMDMMYREIERKYTGSFNSGKFILTFSNGKEERPTLEPIPLASTDGRYMELDSLIKNSIFSANEVTSPELFGIPSQNTNSLIQVGNQLGILIDLAIYQSTVISHQQDKILSVLNKFTTINNVEPFIIQSYKLDLGDLQLTSPSSIQVSEDKTN